MAPGGGGNIKVVVRCRPFNSREKDRNATCIVQMKGDQTVLTPPPGAEAGGGRKGGAKDLGPKTFKFDHSYWSFDKNDPSYAGQDNLFTDLGEPLLDNAFGGYNNCIFAYGQTGSGKSYSMMGYGKEAGVIPQICEHMFKRINKLQTDPNLTCTVEVSYLEIYNERVRDLLNPSSKGALKVREHPSTGPYVEDLAKLVVGSFPEIENLMDEGNKARTVAATNMNETSSRSHAVFTLILTQKRHDVETGFDTEKVSRISLVDLAGSERATSTGATGARLKEGAEINRSLSTLGRVISALADQSTGKGKVKKQVPYRDSVLTWLLKDSLGGNSMTAMIAAISPADINFDETLSTLRYADSAKKIKNHAVVNEDPNARMIRELKEELEQLRSKLSGGAGTAEEEKYDASVPLEKQIVTITAPDGTVKKVSKAEIAEQLQSSEKLLTNLNQTWEEKLEKTQQIHKEREAALEELGISIEKGFIGMSTPKKIPHLVNLSDDPLLDECLVYNIKPGVTHVGNVETTTSAQIRLNGSKILTDHCRFENVDNIVTLIPNENASVIVNGMRIDKPRRLRTGYRIILGDFHIFRFNHPQEARAERDKLRQSVTVGQLEPHRHTPSGISQEILEKIEADAMTGDSRPESPAPGSASGRDVDWSFARREAASTWLGADPKIAALNDEELDNLLEDVQRLKSLRKGRPDSSMDDDMESVMSFPGIREKYLSNGSTLDDMSLDTAITVPSTPQQGEAEERLRAVKEEMQEELEKTKEEFQEKLKAAEEAHVEIEVIKAEKERMQEKLHQAKEEMQRELEKQRQEFENRLEEITLSPPKSRPTELSDQAKQLARWAIAHWKERKYVRMAEDILQNAATLKEAQIMSNEMEKQVVFQFTVVDIGHALASSYDLVLNGIEPGEDDEYLEHAVKPCVGVRVMDFQNEVVLLWSLEKLQNRVRQMRQMYQYLDRPEYLQHFRIGDPFSEQSLPRYSLVGDADVPLTAVLESRSQTFTLEVTSPHSSSVVGIVKLTLEPSSAVAPSSTLKFNVVMHHMHGFSEREGTEVHAQLFVPGISGEGGATTTHMVTNFDEGPVKFDTTHSMSLPRGKSSSLRNASLRVSIFAKVSVTHLEKLLSWDDMRDHTAAPTARKAARIAESEFYTEERHDVFARVQILELAETGEYLPVDVVQTSDVDIGAFQLHQGLQRRIQIGLTHSSGDALQWDSITDVRLGEVRLLDPKGKIPDLTSPTREVGLNVVLGPVVKSNADKTSTVSVVVQWDSSLHNSILLDRTTAAGYRVQMTLKWSALSARVAEPMEFSMDISGQIGSRMMRSSSKLMQLWNNIRIMRASAGVFSLAIRPAAARRAGDLWRMNTMHRYVKGEEYLEGWTPRGVSLVRDFLAAKKRRTRVAEVENARGFLSLREPTINGYVSSKADGHPDQPMVTSTNGSSKPINSGGAEEPIESAEAQQQQNPEVTEAATESNGTGNSETVSELQNTETAEVSATPSDDAPATVDSQPQPSRNEELVKKFLDLWSSFKDPSEQILSQSNTEPPSQGAAFANSPSPSTPPRLIAEARYVVKPSEILKSGQLLMPDPTNKYWVKRHFELRGSYIHVYSFPEAEHIMAINLSHCRIEHQPHVAKLLRRANIFAVYAPHNTYLFAARNQAEMIEWIMKIDQFYFSAGDRNEE